MRISDWSSDVCSSDLAGIAPVAAIISCIAIISAVAVIAAIPIMPAIMLLVPVMLAPVVGEGRGRRRCRRHHRSEEHTSELQSLMRISYAVFCLKKKKHTNTKTRSKLEHYKQLTSVSLE